MFTGKYNAMDIAKYIVRTTNQNGGCISNLKLQKVLYFVQAEFLVSKGEACFMEPIVATNFGPVVRSVYRAFSMFGGASIPYNFENEVIILRPDDAEIINGILQLTERMSASYLTQLSMRQKPYLQTLTGRMIRLDHIYEYFKEE